MASGLVPKTLSTLNAFVDLMNYRFPKSPAVLAKECTKSRLLRRCANASIDLLAQDFCATISQMLAPHTELFPSLTVRQTQFFLPLAAGAGIKTDLH